jgi:hypothetical protein
LEGVLHIQEADWILKSEKQEEGPLLHDPAQLVFDEKVATKKSPSFEN